MCEIIPFPDVGAPWKRLSKILDEMRKKTREPFEPARLSTARVGSRAVTLRRGVWSPQKLYDFPGR